ncbi:MAG: hypothetical protein HZB53_22620 [Chloroflexi bacterium]|nr:hypothetical protein [Chloroflexota bacterium]
MDPLIVTNAAGFMGLALSLWLGFFNITRSPARVMSRVAALTLWACAGFFLSQLMFYNQLSEVRSDAWLAVFRVSVMFIPALWLHTTAELAILDKRRIIPLRRVVLGAAYAIGLIVLITDVVTGQALLAPAATPYSTVVGASRAPSFFFPLYAVYVAFCAYQSARNLMEARQITGGPLVRRAVEWGIRGTIISGVGGLYLIGLVQFNVPWLSLFGDFAFAAGVGLVGYSTAQIAGALDGRNIDRDFRYTLLAIAAVCCAYMAVALLSQVMYAVPFISYVFLLLLAVATHSVFDGARGVLDNLFFTPPTRALRANLRALAHEANGDPNVRWNMNALFAALCQSLGVTRGVLLLREGDAYRIESAYRFASPPATVPPSVVAASEITPLKGETVLGAMVLLAPLRLMDQQEGALALGAKASGANYSAADEEIVLDAADQLNYLLAQSRLHEERTRQLNTQLTEYREAERALQAEVTQTAATAALGVPGYSEAEFVAAVEDAFRHVSDIAYLGEHRLAGLNLLTGRLAPGAATGLDRGRALKDTLVEALNKLKPTAQEPKQPSNEWYPFLILREAYLVGVPNKEIMAHFYISEGTFNRTRRRAIRAVARVLADLEAEAARPA